MNTPAHLLLGAAVMGRNGAQPLIWAAFVGAMLPDLSLYVLAGVSLRVLQIPADRVFNELYFSDLWQGIFAVDNSFIIWGLLLAIACWRRIPWAIALTGAALLHLALDFPLHHDDGRAHFWPLTWWVYESPISYWDRSHGAGWIAPVEAAAASIAAVVLWVRKPGWLISGLVLLLLLAELRVVRTWLWFFVDS
jgi:hypothetical protein